MAFVIEFENGELKEINPELHNPFVAIQQVIDASKKLEEEVNSPVKAHRVVIEVPKLSEESVKFMQTRLGVKIRREKDDTHVVEFESDPVTFYAHYLGVISSIDLGNKLHKLNEANNYQQRDKEYMKLQARKYIQSGVVRASCPTVQTVAKLNGTSVDVVVRILGRYNRTKVREILKSAYEVAFDEPYVENEKKPAQMWSDSAREEQIKKAKSYFLNYGTFSYNNSTTASNSGWNLE